MKRYLSHARVLLPWIVVLTLCAASIQVSVAWAPQPAIQVLNSALPSGVNGLAYQAKLYASGGTGPYTWALLPGSVLPTGTLFQFTSGGVLSGMPTTTGSYSIVVQATDANGKQGSRSYTLAISNSGITTTSLPSGIKGVAYNATLAATGGAAPYSWTIVPGQPGKLPSGLSMSSSGAISGTPGTLGYQEFTVRATDSRGQRFSQTLGINGVMPLTISGSSLPMGTIGRSYKSALGASGGQAPYTWKLVAGTPPSIIGVDTTGTVSGTPTETGSYGFTVQASDASGQQVQTSASIAITGPLAITTTSLPNGKVGALYSSNVAASGGLAPYSWNLTGGMLPPGLTLTTLGGISGTPTTAGSFTFTLQVFDSGGGTSSQTYTVSMAAATAPVSITTTSLPNGTVGTAYSSSVSATGGTSPYTWAVSAGALPAGLVLSGGGGISGTPTAAGSSTFTLKVTDSTGGTSSQAYAVSIVAALVITTTSLPNGTTGVAYSTPVAATGGTAPYTWSIAAGLLPAGMGLGTTTGVISGIPSTSGTYNITVTLGDAAGRQASKLLGIVIAAGVCTSCPALTITTTTVPSGTIGVAYSTTLAATNGTPPYAWSVLSGQLPPGLALNSSAGTISGTPTTAGSYNFAVQATDAASGTASQNFTLPTSTTTSMDQYGGLATLACGNGAQAHFYTQKIGNRWYLCTPDGNAFFFQGVSNISPNNNATSGSYTYQSVINSKFANDRNGAIYGWADNTLARLKAWGFNAIGDSSSDYVQPWGANGGARKPATKMPSIPSNLSSYYSFSDHGNYIPAGTQEKNLMDLVAGSAFSNYVGRGLADVFDPGYASYLTAAWAATLLDPYYGQWLTSPYALGVVVDESDDAYALDGPGIGPPSAPDGIVAPHVGYIAIATPPLRYASSANVGNVTYADPTNYSKLELRRELDQTTYPATGKYSSIAALNNSWGSTYSTFGSSGTQYTGEQVGMGDGNAKVFSGTLKHGNIDHFSVGLKVAGVIAGGDYGDSSFNPQNTFAASSVFDYTYMGMLMYFPTPPARGSAIAVTYTYTDCGGGTATTTFATGDGVTQFYNTYNLPAITWACGLGKSVHSKPGTISLKVNGVTQGTDAASPPAIVGSGVATSFINYATGAYSLAFITAPASGAVITMDYHTNGWCNGGTGLMDECGSNTWLGHTDGVLDPAYASAGTIADLNTFLYNFSVKYFSTHRAAFKASSPKQLMFCPGLNNHGGLTRPQTLQAAGAYCDVIQAGANTQALLDGTAAAAGDVPIFEGFIGGSANADSALHAYANPSAYTTQAQKGSYVVGAVQGTLNSAVTATGIYPNIGWTFWDWADMWCDGGSCSKVNWGLVTSRDNAYDGQEAVSSTNITCQAPQASFATCGGEDANYGDLLTSVKTATALWLAAGGIH